MAKSITDFISGINRHCIVPFNFGSTKVKYSTKINARVALPVCTDPPLYVLNCGVVMVFVASSFFLYAMNITVSNYRPFRNRLNLVSGQ